MRVVVAVGVVEQVSVEVVESLLVVLEWVVGELLEPVGLEVVQ